MVEESVPILFRDCRNREEGKEKEEEEEEEEEEVKEDTEDFAEGGWGWVVVIASFFINTVIDGLGYSFGVLLEPIKDDFGTGSGYVSFVGSILVGVVYLTGPLAAAAINRFGARLTCITGSVVSSLAIFISSFTTRLEILVLTYGVMGGLGLGLMYIPAVVTVGQYFSKRLSFATGICVCGSGAGTFAFAPMASYFVQKWGWRGCNRIMAFFCLICSLFGLVMVPPKKGNSKIKEKNNNRSTWSDILTSPPFLLVMLGNIPACMTIYSVYTYLPSMAESVGISGREASLLISMIGITNTLGRILSGWMTDLPFFSPLVVTIITTVIASLFPGLMPLFTTYPSLMIISAMFGFIISAIPTTTTGILVDLLGIRNLNNSFGALTFVRGIAAFMGPPISGFMLDHFKEYSVPFTISSFLFLFSAILHSLVWFIIRRRGHSQYRSGYTEI